MSRLLIIGTIIYILAKKMDVYIYRPSNNPSKVVDEYVRDDTEEDVQLYPADHHLTDHLMKVYTGPQDWSKGPTAVEQHFEFNLYGPNGEGSYSNNRKVDQDVTMLGLREESKLVSKWANAKQNGSNNPAMGFGYNPIRRIPQLLGFNF